MTDGKKLALAGAVLLTPIALILGMLLLFVAAVANGAAGHQDEKQKRSRTAGARGAPAAVQGIDAVMLSAYEKAAQNITIIRPKCAGMRWSVLAGIGMVESNHASGRTIAENGNITPRIIGVRLNGSGQGENKDAHSDTDNGKLDGDTAYDRAVGPMQFIPATWNGPSGQDGNGDKKKDPHNAFDATLAAAAYLCGTHAADLTNEAQLRKAVFRYNHSQTYVTKVTGHIRDYDRLGPAAAAAGSPAGKATGKAKAVIDAALAAKGTPYVWGGGTIHGPSNGGYDCSGLMLYAFYQGARLTLPRTSQEQRKVGTKVSRDQMRPGDLIVINNNGNWGHVGLYLGGGKMVHAPNPRRTVETVGTAGYWAGFDWDVRRVL
ncbi:hypothetical protein GCM10010329_81120 [Streptomyces spiroverticillatus]|uniref:NlpC/P60 domain-containing protein n=1 Tax=Streptomyces finlayi TaxID=67296 RepID=A0A918X760_9ACTN|nr:C40 family peptidase [Streptomyces finlayi]GHA46335.1 hypothetical protein GCM10010329_81120 [Streptomyces spiroverticillatus]GHD16354.1 hypothetical protein GCM10010334_77380 [Streptomyces finlayi]